MDGRVAPPNLGEASSLGGVSEPVTKPDFERNWGLLARAHSRGEHGAAVDALAATGLGPAWAALLVGVVLCLVALGLAVAGRAALRLRGIWPNRALRGLRRDAEAVQQGLKGTEARHV